MEDAAMPSASVKKRRRGGGAAESSSQDVPLEREVPPFVLVSCFDESDRLIEVDTRLLEPFGCRLFKQVKYDAPSIETGTGRPFWRCGMTRAMLQTFIRSLQHGELSLSKAVSVAEAMTTFEYENVCIGVPAERRGETEASRAAAASLRHPPMGAVFQKRIERMQEIVLTTSEQVAHAIARWPRLESAMDAALSGVPPTTCTTATRAWVRFCKKPMRVPGQGTCEPVVVMTRKWPVWLQMSLVSLGILFAKLEREGTVSSLVQWDEEAFNALVTLVQGNHLGWFLFTAHDFTRKSSDRQQRKDTCHGEQFAAGIRQAILDGADLQSRAQTGRNFEAVESAGRPPSQEYLFARACVTLVEQVLHDAPSPATIYSGGCADDNGKTPERTQLQRSLAQRGIKLIRWYEGDEKNAPVRPLVFPPNWAEGGSSGTVSACMLLDFSERR